MTVSTVSILIAEEVREAEVLQTEPSEQLAIPLEANLDDEPEESDMVAVLFSIVYADQALKQAQKAVKVAAARAKPATQAPQPHVEVSVSAQRKTQEPDVVIEIEDSPAARERGHMLIAIENPNPELEVKIDHRTKGKPILGSTVRSQAI